jgi:bacterioferritin-associated ferredoxin
MIPAMACAIHPAADPATREDPSLPEGSPFARPLSMPMTRCECAGVSFQQIARQMASDGSTLDEVTRRTGCGTTCTACLPDLRRFLSAR